MLKQGSWTLLRGIKTSPCQRATAYSRLVHSQVFPAFSFALSRRIHYSPVLWASKKKKKNDKEKNEKEKGERAEGVDLSSIDLKDTESKFDDVVARFTKQANEVKMGKTNPKIFDELKVETENGLQKFNTIAQTALKGRNFVITVFDPANVKAISGSILSSNLNMNPQTDSSNKQTLKVPLPPLTTESKKENVKNLKVIFEKFKTGSGRGFSLASVRSEVRSKFQRGKGKVSDDEQKILNDLELLHKKYQEKLTSVLKTAEQAILK